MTRTTAPGLVIVARDGDRWYRNEVDARRAKHPNLTVVEMDGPHHIHLEPGYVDTVMTQGLKTFWLISADPAAKTILWCARRGVNERFVPWRWGVVALVLRLIPSPIFRKLNF